MHSACSRGCCWAAAGGTPSESGPNNWQCNLAASELLWSIKTERSPPGASNSWVPIKLRSSWPPAGMPGPTALLSSRMSEEPGVSRVTLGSNTSYARKAGPGKQVEISCCSSSTASKTVATEHARGARQQRQEGSSDVQVWIDRLSACLLPLDRRIERQGGGKAPARDGVLHRGAKVARTFTGAAAPQPAAAPSFAPPPSRAHRLVVAQRQNRHEQGHPLRLRGSLNNVFDGHRAPARVRR